MIMKLKEEARAHGGCGASGEKKRVTRKFLRNLISAFSFAFLSIPMHQYA
jgi:hypothetical protein